MNENLKNNESKNISLKNRRIIIITLFLALIGLCLYVFFNPPKNYAFCFFRNTWGVLCSACGGTHCAYYLMHFQFANAFNENQFLVFALPVVFYLIIAAAINNFFNKKILPTIKNKYFYILFLCLFLIFGIVRNFI